MQDLVSELKLLNENESVMLRKGAWGITVKRTANLPQGRRSVESCIPIEELDQAAYNALAFILAHQRNEIRSSELRAYMTHL